MPLARVHPRIIEHPFAALMQEARLDTYAESAHELVLGVQGFQTLSAVVFEQKARLMERVRARHVPLKLTFGGAVKHESHTFFRSLGQYRMDDPSRQIAFMLTWRMPGTNAVFHKFGLRGEADADLEFTARSIRWEQGQAGRVFTLERAYSPAPPMPGRLVPLRKALLGQFGGDPISIRLAGRVFHRRLFIGGVDIQPAMRPQVDAVLNLGESSSRWVKPRVALDPRDRAVEHGEGSQGMTVAQIREEAGWVIERLRQNQRVLVHCVAGMNRSVTVCCGMLILLEGLSAEEALSRVREHHPWARPDSHHWLALRWLAKQTKGKPV